MRLINQVTTKLCHCFTCICLLWKKKTTLSLEIFTLWDLKRKNSNKVINRNAITIGWRVTGFLHFSVRLMNECDILRSILIESIFLIGKGPRLLYNKQNNKRLHEDMELLFSCSNRYLDSNTRRKIPYLRAHIYLLSHTRYPEST